ncbi:hypothetical protein K461DRAFT_43879 [Myriangium duriaei CBS 260.36]|uniref:Transcription factor domain-containing protein n=1 Tax=Myriangium duriaei CBS 260.36 TaxID=1168546 RepID=A0A9P4MIZ4_9PEZI|nr:hypothetical protein K461DRAFT_43879 [Myriangium duriaei CBS 260.36]
MHEFLFVDGPTAGQDPELRRTVRSHATRHVRRRQREARESRREINKATREKQQTGTRKATGRKSWVGGTHITSSPSQRRLQCSELVSVSTAGPPEWATAACSSVFRTDRLGNDTRSIWSRLVVDDSKYSQDSVDTSQKWSNRSDRPLSRTRPSFADSTSQKPVDVGKEQTSDTDSQITSLRPSAVLAEKEAITSTPLPRTYGSSGIAVSDSLRTCVLYEQPSHAFGCETDRNALQYFYSHAARDISGVIVIGFWDRVVLQTTYVEPAVRQAVVALSQAHTEHTLMKESSTRAVSHRQHPTSSNSLKSLKSYLIASEALRAYVEQSADPMHEIVLVCNIIFHTLAVLRGDEADARSHLDCGLSIFRTWQATKKRPSTGRGECYDYIATMLARFDLSATIADERRVPQFVYDEGEFPSSLNAVDAPLMEFTSAHDAHYQLLRVGTAAWTFVVSNQQYRDIAIEDVPGDVKFQKRLHTNRYRAWSKSMEAFEWKLLYGTDTPKEHGFDRTAQIVSTLATRMHYWCGKRILLECLQDEDSVGIWDRRPEKLLRYAETIIELTTKANHDLGIQQQDKGFSPELGVCSIPMALAHRTSQPRIRSQAIQVSRKFGRSEGMQNFCAGFEAWAQLPSPKPPFMFMLGRPGH